MAIPLKTKTTPTFVAPTKQVAKAAPVLKDLNLKQKAKRKSKAQENMITMRKHLFPLISEEHLWLRTVNHGFTTIPRTMPLFMNVINDLAKSVSDKSVPAAKTYLTLWCRVFDDGILKIDDEAAAAVEAGYVGERNVTTWRDHLKVLKELGFIDFAAGSTPCQWIVIRNPYLAVMELKDRIQPATYNALCQRALEIGAAKDMGLE
ncbi:MAG: hypothetical protein Q8R69_10040 [Telluria sp.]|nr:hypothetical protein [Telluria sp.]